MKRAWTLAAPVVLIGMSIAAVPRPKEQVVNETTPTALTTSNPCNSDAVALAGQTHTVIHVTQAESGNFSADVSVSSTYTGVGVPSGLNYQGSDTYHDQFTVANPLPFEETILQEFHLRSQTGPDNYTLRLQFHFTVNANGILTADVQNPTTKCGG